MNWRSKGRPLVAGGLLIAIILAIEWPAFTRVYRFFAQFPGIIYWVALLIPVGLFAGYMLVRAWGQGEIGQEAKPPPVGSGRLAPLAFQIERSEESEFARAQLVYELSELAVRLIARREGIGLVEARERLRSGEWTDDPTAVRLLSRRDSEPVSEDEFTSALKRTLVHLERFYQEV